MDGGPHGGVAAGAGASPGAAPPAAPAAPAPPPVSHVYLTDAAVDLSQEDVSLLSFDDATQQLLAVKGGHVFAYAAQGGGLRWMYPLQDGPAVMSLRPSLDNRMLAVQRGACLLELVDLASGNCFVHSTHKGRDRILGFFFFDSPGVDLVIVTDRGVELTAFAGRRQGLKLQQRVRRRNDWCVYTHETRMLLVGTGAAETQQGAEPQPAAAAAASRAPSPPLLASWQFTTGGIVHLPLFELHGPLPASAAAREFLAQPQAAPQQEQTGGAVVAAPGGARRQEARSPWAAADAPARPPLRPLPQSLSAGSPPVLSGHPSVGTGSGAGAASCRRGPGVWLLKMYGRVYLAHVARRGAAAAAAAAGGRGGSGSVPGPVHLELYRFYSDTLLLERLYDLVSAEVDLSVVDNVLVVHYTSAAVAVLVDVALPGRQPLTEPLPLRRLVARPPPGAAAAAAGSAPEGPPRGGYESREAAASPGWRLVMPNMVLDISSKRLYKLALDLAAVAESVSDWPALAGFLQRRRASPAAAAAAAAAPTGHAAGGGAPAAAAAAAAGDPRALLLGVCRAALQEPLELSALADIFGQLVQSYADALARSGGAAQPGRAGRPPGVVGGDAGSSAPPAVTLLSPRDLSEQLFKWAHDEEVVDALYLQAAVSEYCAAVEAAGIPTPPDLVSLGVELLLQQGLAHQALQLLRAQPSALGLPLAQRLAAEGACNCAAAASAGGASGGGAEPGPPGGSAGAAALPSAAAAAASAAPPGCSRPPGLACQMVLEVYARQAAAEARQAARSALPGPAAGAAAPSAMAAAAAAAPAARAGIAAAAASVAGVPLGIAAAAASASALAQAGRRGALQHNEAYVRQLVASGQLLRAARLVRDRGLVQAVRPDELLRAAAARGDAALFSALHRVLGLSFIGADSAGAAMRRVRAEGVAGAVAGGAGAAVAAGGPGLA